VHCCLGIKESGAFRRGLVERREGGIRVGRDGITELVFEKHLAHYLLDGFATHVCTPFLAA
jgi:hypothetical protein